ncbi:Desumoylating isopeptidase 2 [Dermatophagoides pteronyssinus]|uniref:Desumoylating isopeptidase 2 n=1 Tax=Dermatophagoides pteronyssinus TaxID=6956 RepID=A0ABQ8IZ01_DERPT|nr:Desumoylating isopeptidase 2 [Dermatophagoides pteronyssinus]
MGKSLSKQLINLSKENDDFKRQNNQINYNIIDDNDNDDEQNDNLVKLNVYGIPIINNMISFTGLGIYHTGVEVYGKEWAYGGYPLPVSSIFRMRCPKDIASLSRISGHLQFDETIIIGPTDYSLQEIEYIIAVMGSKDYIGTKYHLLHRNCNTFSNELCMYLCNKPIPTRLNRLAQIIGKFPFITQMIPEEYFTPIALEKDIANRQNLKQQQQPKYKSEIAAKMINTISPYSLTDIMKTKMIQSVMSNTDNDKDQTTTTTTTTTTKNTYKFYTTIKIKR